MKFLRRILPVIICISILVSFSVVPVSATSYDPGYQYSYDILSLTTADGDNHVSVGTSGSVTFELPYVLNGNYVDVVISTSSGAITAAQCGNAAAQQDLNVLAVSSRVFRVYGTINNRSFSELQLNLTTNNESTSVDFLSFRLFKPAVNIHQTLGCISCQVLSLDSQHYGQTSYGEVLPVSLPWETGSSEIDTASILLTAPQWQKYDYVEFMVYGKFSSLDAIVARVDSLSVPFTVTPVDGSADVFASHSDNVWRNLVISIDLRDVVRSNSLDEDLRLRVDLNISYFNGAQATFYLNTVNGIIDSGVTVTDDFWWSKVLSALSDGFGNVVDAVSGIGSDIVAELQSGFPGVVSAVESVRTAVNNLTSGFTQWVQTKWTQFANNWNTKITAFQSSIETWFETTRDDIVLSIEILQSNLLAAFDSFYDRINLRWTHFTDSLYGMLNPPNEDLDEFNDAASDVADDIGGLVDGLNAVDKPSVNDIPTDLTIYVDSSAMSIMTGTLSSLFEISHFTSMLTIVLILTLGGFVLFGKR